MGERRRRVGEKRKIGKSVRMERYKNIKKQTKNSHFFYSKVGSESETTQQGGEDVLEPPNEEVRMC